MRRQDHADFLVSDRLHENLEELTTSERVQTGDGLVEQKQLWPLGDCQGERQLGALTPGELSGTLARIETELLDTVLGQLGVPAGIEMGAQAKMVADAERGIDGRFL